MVAQGPISSTAHWRDASRRPRFYFIEAYASFPILIFLLHIRWWTFFLAIGIIIFFVILERFKFTIPVFFRLIRAYVAGPDRIAKPWFRR